MTSQLPLDLEPVRRKPGQKLKPVMIGSSAECLVLTRKMWSDLEIQIAEWLQPWEKLPRVPLKVAFATPRDKLPTEMQEALNKLERDGALEVWAW